MIYELKNCNDPILKSKLEKFDFSNPPVNPIDFAYELSENMLHHNGIGLAANQLGLPYNVFAIKAENIIVCYNPKIVDFSEETIYLEEGCLSSPNLFVKIKRPKTIKVRYTQPNGEVVTKVFDGLTSRIFQHEYDHLLGIDFKKRATTYHLELAKKRIKNGKRINY